MSTYSQNYKPDFVIPPGATLKELLEKISMSQAELAMRISRPEKTISEIVNGIAGITPDTSIQLERALGIPASFWNNLQKNYQENQARILVRERLISETKLLANFPYQTVSKYGWLKKTRDKVERIENLLGFFAIDSLQLVPKVYPVAFRLHNGKSISPGSLAVWLRKGEIDSQEIQTDPYNSNRINNLIHTLRAYTKESPKEFVPKLVAELAKCGVALVFTRDLPKTYVCGATRWLTPEKALIQLSLRGSYADIMWFTLYHEMAHILLHSKREKFVDLQDKSSGDIKEELEANEFAATSLIPKEKLDGFISSADYSAKNIKVLADEIGVNPSIIVGRLQHEKLIKFSALNHLRTRYTWKT